MSVSIEQLEKLLDAAAQVLADRVAAKIDAQRFSRDELVDQTTAPIAKARYLRAARAGLFPAHRHGRKVYALRSDVMAWIRSKARDIQPPAPAPSPANDEPELDLDEIRKSLKLRRKAS